MVTPCEGRFGGLLFCFFSAPPILLRLALHRWCIRIFDLHPMRRAPRTIGRAESLRHDAPMTVSEGRGAWRHPFISFQATARAKARTINTEATINTRQYCVPSTFRSDLLKRAKHSGHLYVSKPLAVPNLVPHCGHVTRGASGMRRKINWQPPINNDRQARKNSN
jgi:hypothetical protein